MRDIIKVIFRMLSLVLFYKVVNRISEIIMFFIASDGYMESQVNRYLGFNILLTLIFCVVAGVIWRYSNQLADMVSEGTTKESLVLNIDYREGLLIGLKILGVVIIIMSIDSFVAAITNIVVTDYGQIEDKAQLSILFGVFMPAVKIAAGYLLITREIPWIMKNPKVAD